MGEQVDIGDTLETVKERMAQMRGQLENLSRTIWQDIDHEDAAALEAGVRFKQRYNERRGALEQAMTEMLALLGEYPVSGPGTGAEVPPEAPLAETPEEHPTPSDAGAHSGIQASALAGDLDKKAPFGFMLGGQTFTSASAWPLFYEALLQELYGRDPERISRLADEPGDFRYRGKPLFARVPDRLDDPLPIAEAIFAEADVDPEVLLGIIKRLIGEMGYPLDTFKILLREKNRGTVETLSIAA
jgi:hypothetical protein